MPPNRMEDDTAQARMLAELVQCRLNGVEEPFSSP